MTLFLLGVNHRTAALEDREALALLPAEVLQILERLARRGVLRESLVLSTCNRTEIYAVAAEITAAEQEVRDAQRLAFPDTRGGVLRRSRGEAKGRAQHPCLSCALAHRWITESARQVPERTGGGEQGQVCPPPPNPSESGHSRAIDRTARTQNG